MRSPAHTPMQLLAAGPLALVLICGALACAPFSTRVEDPESTLNATLPPAAGYDFTRTVSVYFGAEHVGFVVQVLEVPTGLRDLRDYEPRTWLVQNLDFMLIGFISPAGVSYTFDEDNNALFGEVGDRDLALANIFERPGTPDLRDA